MLDEKTKPIYAGGVALVIILLFAIPTTPPLTHLIAGFFPLLLTTVLALGLFQSKKTIPMQAAIGAPVVLALLLALMGALGPSTIFGQLEIWYLSVINALGGILVMGIMTDFWLPSPTSSTPSHVHRHIEDTVRFVFGLNEAIKRVYSPHRGALVDHRNEVLLSAQSAERLEKVFEDVDYEEAHHIVYQLYEQLRRLFEPEATVFGKVHFKGLQRDAQGKSRVIDVLIANDSETVRDFVEGLTHALQSLNEELLGLRRQK